MEQPARVAIFLSATIAVVSAGAYLIVSRYGYVKLSPGQLSEHFWVSDFTQWDPTGSREVPPAVMDRLGELAGALEAIRSELGAELSIGRRGGWRPIDVADPGARPGEHTAGGAADFWTGLHTPWELRDVVEELIASGRIPQGGVGVYDPPPGVAGDRMVHYDTRGRRARWWGDTTPHVEYPYHPDYRA